MTSTDDLDLEFEFNLDNIYDRDESESIQEFAIQSMAATVPMTVPVPVIEGSLLSVNKLRMVLTDLKVCFNYKFYC